MRLYWIFICTQTEVYSWHLLKQRCAAIRIIIKTTDPKAPSNIYIFPPYIKKCRKSRIDPCVNSNDWIQLAASYHLTQFAYLVQLLSLYNMASVHAGSMIPRKAFLEWSKGIPLPYFPYFYQLVGSKIQLFFPALHRSPHWIQPQSLSTWYKALQVT